MSDDDEVLGGHVQEIRRGSVVLACLAVLRTPQYGYALLSTLDEAGFPVDANTLYPLLRRLEKQGLLSSEWNTDESRPRKFYVVSPLGERLRDEMAQEWADLGARIESVLRGGTP
ncbi:PadR family transcriptional regulator [Nocardioides lijunqiniae]|uniref:PadR family transcriptional regulator n=1 Tax=Nocardioides lijunqiniae TaxID=2760832 RepID=UPI001877D426|nr:PadR family transcriptional regulator [Nocardioides lijunqiniae]